jgi:site-specific DNA recombinase
MNLNNTDKEQQRLEQLIEMLGNIEKLEPGECNAFLKTFIKKIWFSSNSIANHNTKKEASEVTIKIEWL